VCCNGHLHCKPSTYSRTYCCGSNVYNSSTQKCCYCGTSTVLSDALALDSKLPDASEADDDAQDSPPPGDSDAGDVKQDSKLSEASDADDSAQDSQPLDASDSGNVKQDSKLP